MAATRPLGAVHARVDSLASTATLLLDAERYSGSGSWLNVGTGGALDAALPGGANDPKFLAAPSTIAASRVGYTYLPGVAANRITFTRASQAAPTTFELAARVTLDTISVTNYLAGWNGTFAQFFLTGANLLSIDIIDVAVATRIGNAPSSVAVPGIAAGTKIWLRGQVTIATASCAYWYSLTDTDDYAAVSWTSVGTPQIGTGAGLTPSVAQSTSPLFGSVSAGAAGFAGILHAGAEVLSGATTIKFDTNTTEQASFTATTGGTATIVRSTAGRKTVQVVRPTWLFGTNDYLTIPDNANLDFDASTSLTLIVAARLWNTQPGFGGFAGKIAASPFPGYQVLTNGATTNLFGSVDDGATNVTRAGLTSVTAGTISSFGIVVNRTAQTLATFNGGTVSATASVAAVGTLATTAAFQIGSTPESTFGDFECFAVLLFRTALTAAEVAAVSDSLNAGTLT